MDSGLRWLSPCLIDLVLHLRNCLFGFLEFLFEVGAHCGRIKIEKRATGFKVHHEHLSQGMGEGSGQDGYRDNAQGRAEHRDELGQAGTDDAADPDDPDG